MEPATPITTGALLGSLRAVDVANSWFAPGGRPLLPYHPYTLASKQPVPIGSVTRFGIEIRPTFAQLAAGHRLRLTLTTTDLPTLVPTTPDGANLTGGVYQVQRNAAAASFIELLSAPAAQLRSGARATRHRRSHRRKRGHHARRRRHRSPGFTG
jgi:hypothetical protein